MSTVPVPVKQVPWRSRRVCRLTLRYVYCRARQHLAKPEVLAAFDAAAVALRPGAGSSRGYRTRPARLAGTSDMATPPTRAGSPRAASASSRRGSGWSG